MAEPTQRPPQGLLDTSVVIDLDVVDPDLLIASTAAANGLLLYTRNPADFVGLEELVTVKVV